ncbi:hypothetical protein PILCRDRAFT_8369 [Piloderma croceum F 1598]|uniref:Uncharacterized protein n=1 Tax=Piloderma croceum (strain F 1598) TaxID=765440 RepID=A0A0C3FAN4_PILCF|nr:hypothetical protein PILCRDRAFT_8369 [Piloderma croceum F 1598]
MEPIWILSGFYQESIRSLPGVHTLYQESIRSPSGSVGECNLQHEAHAQEESLKLHLIELQAANILNEAYCSRICGQLAHKEDKGKETKGKGKLVGNGLPCLLSGDVFYERVVDAEVGQRREEREKVVRKGLREQRAEVLAEWKKQQDTRKADVTMRRAQWEEEKEEWEAEKAAAKTAEQKFTKKKPALGKLLAVILRLPVVAVHNESSDNKDNARSDNNDE